MHNYSAKAIRVASAALLALGVVVAPASTAEAHVAKCYRNSTTPMKPKFYFTGRLYASQEVSCPPGSFSPGHITRVTMTAEILYEARFDRLWPFPDKVRWMVLGRDKRVLLHDGKIDTKVRISCANGSQKYMHRVIIIVTGAHGPIKSVFESKPIRRIC